MSKYAQNLKAKIVSITAVFTLVMLMYIPVHAREYQDTIPKTDTLTRNELRELKQLKRDSIRNRRDSIRWSVPRILDTYILEDSMQYKRLISWNHNGYLNDIQLINPDTTFNENIYIYPYQRRDVGATTLGVSGSATQYHNYFKRERFEIFEPFEQYLMYSHTKETLPFYNVKTPYTELAYWGTLFANRDKEETNIKFLHSQNLSPGLNINMSYHRYGGKGLVGREATDNRTLSLSANYLGKRYVMHTGYIFHGVKREENGGLVDDRMVLDTTLEDSKDLQYKLQSADNHLKRNTFFLTHSYGIPIRLSEDDTLGIDRGTATYFGHSFEYSTMSKKYTDRIEPSDSVGRRFYNNMFLMSPTESFDSVRVSNLENRFFIRLQPFSSEAIVSKLNGGIGHQLLSIYNFSPDFYLSDTENSTYNNLYLYFGAEGSLRKYFQWDAMARYNISGYYENNFMIDGKARFSVYPHKEGIHLTGRVLIENKRPNWFNNKYYSNHYQWDNNFDNITETRIEGNLDIPRYRMSAFAGYALVNNSIYYGNQGIVAQHNDNISIISAYLQKNFKFGFLHLNNRVLFQMSSNNEIIPLPAISANFRYFMQFELVKKVLTAQIGADVTVNTSYYAPAYNPALGVFQNQNERKIGNYPYIDAFVNLQWKRTSVFVKYINAAQDWPDSDYFSAHNYIRPQSAIQVGIHWPFYIN